jgi:hypothetical protein
LGDAERNGYVHRYGGARTHDQSGSRDYAQRLKDASLLFTTSTNTSYTVLVSGAAGETGVALVEVYDVTGR